MWQQKKNLQVTNFKQLGFLNRRSRIIIIIIFISFERMWRSGGPSSAITNGTNLSPRNLGYGELNYKP
jgi:hypothetical protein